MRTLTPKSQQKTNIDERKSNDKQIRCLLGHHHLYELLVVDLTISIDIGFADHFVNLFIGQLFTKVGHDVTKLGGRDEAISVLVKDLEGFKDLFFAVGVLHLAGHHGQEFREINGSAAIGVDL